MREVTERRRMDRVADPNVSGASASEGSRWVGLLGVAGLLACGVAFFMVVQSIGPERMRDAVAATGLLAPVVFVVLKAVTVVITPLTGSPLRLVAGAMFGFWEGVTLSVLGGVLGGSANFWIARLYGRRVVNRLLGPGALARVDPILGRLSGWKGLALARVALGPLWDVLSYGVGLTRLKYRTYLIVAILGDLIPTMILVGFGSSVAEVGVMETGTSSAQALETSLPALLPAIGIGAAGLLVLMTAVVLRPRALRLLGRPARPTIVPPAAPPAAGAETEVSQLAS
ncbi:MAG: VTT domain-containing protein [Chloroflexota bacterium]